MVVARRFERTAHPIAPARFLGLAFASASRGLGGGNEHAQLLQLKRAGTLIPSPTAAMQSVDQSGFDPVTRQGESNKLPGDWGQQPGKARR
jgi:hypothetical protein